MTDIEILQGQFKAAANKYPGLEHTLEDRLTENCDPPVSRAAAERQLYKLVQEWNNKEKSIEYSPWSWNIRGASEKGYPKKHYLHRSPQQQWDAHAAFDLFLLRAQEAGKLLLPLPELKGLWVADPAEYWLLALHRVYPGLKLKTACELTEFELEMAAGGSYLNSLHPRKGDEYFEVLDDVFVKSALLCGKLLENVKQLPQELHGGEKPTGTGQDYVIPQVIGQANQILQRIVEFRSLFMSLAIVESTGELPANFWEFEIADLTGGIEGTLQLKFLSDTGEISCAFRSGFGEEAGELRDWILKTNKKKYNIREYEELLFSTWDYNIGRALDRNENSEVKWYIPDFATANRLEHLAEEIDGLMHTIPDRSQMTICVGDAGNFVRNFKPKWCPCRVRWSYVYNLDEYIRKFENYYSHEHTEQATEPVKELENEEPTKRSRKSKYTPEKIKNMLTSYEKHLQEKDDVKYAWNCVAEEHGIESGKAAEMAVRRHQKKNK